MSASIINLGKFCLVAHVIKYLYAFYHVSGKIFCRQLGIIAKKFFSVYINLLYLFSLCFSSEDKEEGAPSKQLSLELKYGPNGERVIRHIRRVSKPGRRVYSPATALKPILNGLGISIISTSRGVISDREARQRNLGGEVLCEVW